MSEDYAASEPSRAEVDALVGATLLEFGSPFCGHCLRAQDLIASALTGHEDVRHLKIADGRGRPLGRSFGVKLWPTLVLLRNGVELARVVRPLDAATLAAALQALLEPASPATLPASSQH